MKFLTLILAFFITTVNATEFTVMHGPGGVSDITTRFLANEIADKSYIVINRPGAAGRIALRHMIDKNTMMLATMPQVFVTNPLSFNDLDHDPNKDLTVLATVAIMPNVLICHKNIGIKNLDDFLTTKKQLTFAVAGYGSSEHLSTEVLLKKTNVQYTIVPFSTGGASGITTLLGGHVDCMFGNYPTIKPHLSNENLITLFSSHDLGLTVKTWSSLFGEPFPFNSYLAVIVPSAMPAETKLKIRNDLQESFLRKDFNDSLKNLGLFPYASTSEKRILAVAKNNEALRKFIVDNKIKIRP